MKSYSLIIRRDDGGYVVGQVICHNLSKKSKVAVYSGPIDDAADYFLDCTSDDSGEIEVEVIEALA